MRLAGRVALVTGASRGVGRATALALASRGQPLALTHDGRGKSGQVSV